MLYNIIICDDNPYNLNTIIHITENYFQNKKGFSCKIHSFCDYNNDYIHFLYNTRLPNLIFLLDIETPSGSGFDIARKIKQLDPNIPYIYITGYYKHYSDRALCSCDMQGYINKFGDIEKELTNKFDKIISLKGKKYIFTIQGYNIVYTINVKNINYFTTGAKNTVVVMGTNYTPLYISINSLYRQLDHRFIKTHQSCIVNLDNIKEFYIQKKIIYFKDGSSTDLIARDFTIKNKEWLYEYYMDKIVFK